MSTLYNRKDRSHEEPARPYTSRWPAKPRKSRADDDRTDGKRPRYTAHCQLGQAESRKPSHR